MIAAVALAALTNLTVTVPMRIVRHEPLVQVKIEGHGPYWAIVDTGTDPSVIDAYLARQLGKRREVRPDLRRRHKAAYRF
jgi:hypothetical protein